MAPRRVSWDLPLHPQRRKHQKGFALANFPHCEGRHLQSLATQLVIWQWYCQKGCVLGAGSKNRGKGKYTSPGDDIVISLPTGTNRKKSLGGKHISPQKKMKTPWRNTNSPPSALPVWAQQIGGLGGFCTSKILPTTLVGELYIIFSPKQMINHFLTKMIWWMTTVHKLMLQTDVE